VGPLITVHYNGKEEGSMQGYSKGIQSGALNDGPLIWLSRGLYAGL
jgi:hypothetical protein